MIRCFIVGYGKFTNTIMPQYHKLEKELNSFATKVGVTKVEVSLLDFKEAIEMIPDVQYILEKYEAPV